MSWTDERIEDLKALYAEGLSAGRIALELGGISRNAVIGKAHRLGLEKRGGSRMGKILEKPKPKHRPVRREKFKPHVRLAEPPPAPEPIVEHDDSAIPMKQRRTIFQLENHHCRWPCGHPYESDFFFCSAPTADVFAGQPYCPQHAARAFAGVGKAPDRYPMWGSGHGRKPGRARA